MKLGNSVDIRLEATELPKIEPYAVVELEEPVYAPYVQRGNFPVLVEKITCCLLYTSIFPQRNNATLQSFRSGPKDCIPSGSVPDLQYTFCDFPLPPDGHFLWYHHKFCIGRAALQ